MFLSSSACHEVVTCGDGEKVENIRANTLQERSCFLGGEGGKGRTRLGKFNDVTVILRCREELRTGCGGEYWNFKLRQSLEEPIWDRVSSVGVFSDL